MNNIWRAHNLQPHRTKSFKLSRDPRFLEKMTDVVGLYLNPPQQAIVLCVDGKKQVQGSGPHPVGVADEEGPLRDHDARLQTPWNDDPIRGAGDIAGKVVGECHQRHRHQEFLKFLRRLDREFPGTVPLHLIMDNYGTHKHEKVREWLKRHPRFVPHFVPTSSSWMNLVERWFGHLDNKATKRAAFLQVAI